MMQIEQASSASDFDNVKKHVKMTGNRYKIKYKTLIKHFRS